MDHPVIEEPAPPLNRFDQFPFAVMPFPFGDLERTDGFEPVRLASLPVDSPVRFEPFPEPTAP